MTTYGLCQLCPQLCLVFLAPLGTVWAQVGLLPARSPKRETYKRITGKKTLPGIRGLALAHTRACRPSHGVILAVTLCCYILQNVTSGGNQAVYRELCILSHTARDSTDIATKIQLNKTP